MDSLKKLLNETVRGLHAPEYDDELIKAVDDTVPEEWQTTQTRAKQVLHVAQQFVELYDPERRIPEKLFNDITLDVAEKENCKQSNIDTLAARIYGADDEKRPEDEPPYVQRFRDDLITIAQNLNTE